MRSPAAAEKPAWSACDFPKLRENERTRAGVSDLRTAKVPSVEDAFADLDKDPAA